MTQSRLDISQIYEKLQGNKNGKAFWRSLEELAETEAFHTLLREELPRQTFASAKSSRRDFLKFVGAALAMASLSGCTNRPREVIVPYVEAPEEIVPGKPLYFASAMPINGYGFGVLVENHMGRPTKVEGNPDHPASLGATNPYMQGSIFTLYDPDRSEVAIEAGNISTWERFLDRIALRMGDLRERNGAGLHILTETVTSPTLGAQIRELLTAFPQARWHQYEPVGLDNVRAGAAAAFGQYANVVYNFEQAERILSLDANFLARMPGSLHYARDFMDRRRLWTESEMNRLYVVESSPTITGAKADHRLPLRADQIERFAVAVAIVLGVVVNVDAPQLSQVETSWISALVMDLQAHRGRSLVIAGEEQPPAVHALAHAINAALDNVGNTVIYTEPVEVEPVIQIQSLLDLVGAMSAGEVDTLIILDGNPVLTAPADLGFATLLATVDFTIHHSLYFDETSELCDWHIPATHYLESWSDVRAFDGTASIIQPLITPLFQGRGVHEVMAALLGQRTLSSYEALRRYWAARFEMMEGDEPFEIFWRRALHDGVIAGTAAAPIEVSLDPGWTDALTTGNGGAITGALEILFRPDPSILDGRFASNAWLQELPKPLSTLTWDNAALISPATALRLGVTTEDLVSLEFDGRSIPAAVWVMPGHADESVTLYLGYGRTWESEIGSGYGFNAYQLRTTSALYFGSGLTLRPTGQTYELATVQNHFALEGRDLVRGATLEHFLEEPDFAHEEHHWEGETPSLYPEYEYEGHAWGMVVDLTACIGCNACVIGCMTENNIPVVGKEGVQLGREMHWIKVDQYFAGDLENPEVYFQPRPCMHCEKAPCEVVCPVEATVHDSEGLNQMIYNRCVGTRYCSNNCPYKVRRYNFFDYVDDEIELLKMWRNPDVTVRSRGIMEKCTYCVQRINHTRIEAEKENRPIGPGEILTACQQACPTEAIVFGNINDEEWLVTALKAHPLNYGMLAQLGTQPRTTYLAAVTNPNPAMGA
jgi:molybdopterin-containing oxidoreductase family iron-sulfur binding subunit